MRAIVEVARECLERHPDGSFEAFTAREALRNYLPETLTAYFTVPEALRRASRAGCPSADDVLSNQLAILDAGLQRIREADTEAGRARMAANGAFLNERFASIGPPAGRARRSLANDLADVIEIAFRRA